MAADDSAAVVVVDVVATAVGGNVDEGPTDGGRKNGWQIDADL